MTKNSTDPAVLLARSAKLKLFVMLRRTVRPEMLPERLSDHLQWIIAQEKEGRIFLSGPITSRTDATPLDGLTIIRAADLSEAEALASQDPFIQSGIVAFEMREWTVNEGALPLVVTLSDSLAVFR
jgi:uncharacterized protein